MGIKPINNGEIKKRVSEAFSDAGGEQTEGYNSIIQPVVEVNRPTVNILSRTTSGVTGSSTAYTVPASPKRFFLTGAYFGYTKNAACDMTTLTLAVSLKETNESVILAQLYSQTTTAGDDHQDLDFSCCPIELTPGSSIALTGSFAAGAATKYGHIRGYTIGSL